MTSPHRTETHHTGDGASRIRKRGGIAVLASLAFAVLPAVAAATPALAEPAATPRTATSCGSWTTRTPEAFGKNTKGTVDTSIGVVLQFQQCVFGPDITWSVRVAVTNHRASGKKDFAVAIKANGGDLVGGPWHPSVPAPTTWDSSGVTAHCGSSYYAEFHTTYPTDNYYGRTASVKVCG